MPKRKSEWTGEVLARFVLGFEGTRVTPELASLLEAGLGGVAIFARNYRGIEELRSLTAETRRAAARPVLIGIDQEGGSGRFAVAAPFTVWPSAAALGRIGDAALVEEIARAIGRELRTAGANLDFAPMLDLHVQAESPITRERSFGAEPELVARMGVAFARGLREGDVLACAKHFPGHGDTRTDPHLDLPMFSGTLERLETAELVPFAAAIAESVPLIMTAHILLPQVDAARPASLSRRILTGLLRERMGFQGAIIADDLGMGAIAKTSSAGRAAVETFAAGADLAMLCHDESAIAPAIDAVLRALEAGRFDAGEWRESNERIERLRAAADPMAGAVADAGVIGGAEHRALSETAFGRVSEIRG
ncbi:MAG: beta-N-acetylhexosaminidase [Candidatus Acidiferrales bacterium]